MALRFGEYRESVDIDFLVSDLEGYRQLRQRLVGAQGIDAITRPGHRLEPTREIRADQYGVRTLLHVHGIEIKLEIVLEGRITLQTPGQQDVICGISTLTALDMATSKLLANSDRWCDSAVCSRDLIDLAMMAPSKALLRQAIEKAETAYGNAIRFDLAKAVTALREHPQRLGRCMQSMRMTDIPQAVLWARIKTLASRAGALP